MDDARFRQIRLKLEKRSWWHSFFGLASQHHDWVALFDEMESEPLFLPDPKAEEKKELLQMGEILRKQLDPKLFMAIDRRSIALYYRLEAINGGGDPEEVSADWLKREAFLWKKGQPLFWEGDLTPDEEEALEEASRYKLFMDLISRNREIEEAFFQWVIRDHLPVDIFIQYPRQVELIYQDALAGRIGTVSGKKLRIRRVKEEGRLSKFVTLPFEGREVNILNRQKKVRLRGGMEKTIEEYFSLFRIREQQFVDVEYFAEGVSNWNSQHLGIWDEKKGEYEVIDLLDKEWWRQLPPVEILTLAEAEKKYGASIEPGHWVVTPKAARKYFNLDYSGCHAYLEVAIPSRDHFSIYSFGKFAREFPYGVVDNMRMFTQTTLATVSYPDENIYQSSRQHAGFSFFLNHYEGLVLMEEIRRDIVEARKENMIFQFESDNCAHWIQTHMEELLGKERVPNLFRVALLSSEASGFMGLFFRALAKLPAALQTMIFKIVHLPFGAWRGRFVVDKQGRKTYKALTKTHFWEDNIVYLPAFLHRQKERGSLGKNEEETPLARISNQSSVSAIVSAAFGGIMPTNRSSSIVLDDDHDIDQDAPASSGGTSKR